MPEFPIPSARILLVSQIQGGRLPSLPPCPVRLWKHRHGSAGVENAGVAAMERQSNTKGSSTTRRQSSVFSDVATFVTYIIIIIC